MKRLGLLALLPAFALAAEGQPPDGKALFEKKCGVCHGLADTTSKRKTVEEWAKTLARMRAAGSALTDDEAGSIADYLGKTYGP